MKALLIATFIFFVSYQQPIHGQELKSTIQNSEKSSSVDFQIIRLEFSASNNASRELILGFSNQTTDGYDYGYDAQMSNFFPNDFASLMDTDKMVIQAFSEITTDKEVGFVLNSDSNYTYTISILELDNIPDSRDIYLYDADMGVHHDLRISDYVFTANAGEDSSRFKLKFNNVNSLSVDEDIKQDVSVFVDSKSNTLYTKQLNEEVKSLQIYNVIGQKVHELKNLDRNRLESGVALNTLNRGVYIVNVLLESGRTVSKKVIIG